MLKPVAEGLGQQLPQRGRKGLSGQMKKGEEDWKIKWQSKENLARKSERKAERESPYRYPSDSYGVICITFGSDSY